MYILKYLPPSLPPLQSSIISKQNGFSKPRCCFPSPINRQYHRFRSNHRSIDYSPDSVRLDSDIGQDSNLVRWSGSMITRSKLVEQLRDYQIRSQKKWSALTVFSPKPVLSTRTDAAVSIFWALLFIVLLVSSYSTLYLNYYWISFIIMCLGILIPIRLRISRQSLARKRDRRLLLPLSM